MQNNVVILINTRRHVQRNSGKERLQRDTGRCCSRAANCCCSGGNTGDEKFISTHFQHRLLVVQRGNARAGQDMHTALRLEEVQQPCKITALKCQAKQTSRVSGCANQAGTRRT